MSVLVKINELRNKIKEAKLKKSGKNEFAKFEYYELGDFLPQVIELEKELKLISLFSEVNVSNDVAKLIVIDTEDNSQFEFTTSIKEANVKGMLDIQQLGSIHTYLKRYLYLNYLNLTEPDGLDKMAGKKDLIEEQKTPITSYQIDTIKNLLENDESKLAYTLNAYKVKKFEDLTLQQGGEIIRRIKAKQKENAK